MVQMIHTMGENGIDVSEKFFIRDMALTIELVKGAIYRDMKMEHPVHPFVEEFVDLSVLDDDSVLTEIDFDSINEIADLNKTIANLATDVYEEMKLIERFDLIREIRIKETYVGEVF